MTSSSADQTHDSARRRGTAPSERTTLPTWRVVLDMVRYRKGLWLGNLVSMIVLTVFWQLPGLLMRDFFNYITGDAPVRLGLWSMVALLFAFEVGRALGVLGLISTNVPFFVHTMTLLRKNLLRHILRRPGASALPDSPGEAVSRFKGDVFEISLFALWLNDSLGLIVFGVAAIWMMARINAQITYLALVPFILVSLVSNAASSRIEKYRRASRRATGIVTGFIGEIFGAVQAVKVATAEEGVIAHFNETERRTPQDGLAGSALQRDPARHLSQRYQRGYRRDPHSGRPSHARRHLYRGRPGHVHLLPGGDQRADHVRRHAGGALPADRRIG